MTATSSSQTSDAHGRLWGAQSRDWANLQEPVHRPIYDESFRRTRLGAGTSFLDAGCGSGLAAMTAAALGAKVSGLDASEALLEIARERVPEGRFAHGDLENLPYDDHSFDVVTGFNSFQYAGNPHTALAEAGRVTRRGGFVVVTTWGEPDGMEAAQVIAALKPLLPPPPPGAPGPFALSDRNALTQYVAEAGLQPVDIFDVDAPFNYPDEATAVRALGSSGVAARAIEFAGEAAVNSAHKEAIAPFTGSNGSIRIGATFRCLLAAV